MLQKEKSKIDEETIYMGLLFLWQFLSAPTLSRPLVCIELAAWFVENVKLEFTRINK